MRILWNKPSRNTIACTLVAALFGLGYAGAASASLVFKNDSNLTAEGYGNVINLLSMHAPDGGGTATDIEDGKVAWDGSSDVISSPAGLGFELTDPIKTATHTFGSVGLNGTAAAISLRLIWDPTELDSSPATQVNTLILSIYAGDGTLVFTDSLAAPVFHDHVVAPGLGVGDFVYRLDTADVATLQATLNAAPGGDFSAYRIGLESNVSFVDGASDTWLLARRGSEASCAPSAANNFCGQPEAIVLPEPGILPLLAIGLFGVVATHFRRRRIRAHKQIT